MRVLWTAIAVIWVMALLAGHAGWYAPEASAFDATSAELTARLPPPSGTVGGVSPVEADDFPDPLMDFRGNEVENAIADYRIDLGGGIYERHSPETAVPRLGSPST